MGSFWAYCWGIRIRESGCNGEGGVALLQLSLNWPIFAATLGNETRSHEDTKDHEENLFNHQDTKTPRHQDDDDGRRKFPTKNTKNTKRRTMGLPRRSQRTQREFQIGDLRFQRGIFSAEVLWVVGLS
jgi:hypothetical protein